MKNPLFYSLIALVVAFSISVDVVQAVTVVGNGYSAEQSLVATSSEVEGNGYSASQVFVPVSGAMTGNGYSSQAASNSNPITPASSTVTTVVSSQSGSNSSYILAFNLPIATEIASAEVLSADSGAEARAQPELADQLDTLIRPFIGAQSKGLSTLYDELGTIVSAPTLETGVAGVQEKVVEVVKAVYDSKSTFSVLTMAVVVLLFMSLGVSVFGYKEIHKIISAVVCFGSLFGYYTTSKIYLLPAVVGLVVLIIFMIQQKEHEVTSTASIE